MMDSLEALLLFYKDAGVDEPLREAPVNRLAEGAAARERAARQDGASDGPSPSASTEARASDGGQRTDRAPAPERTTPPRMPSHGDVPVPDEAAIAAAREMARNATTLEQLRAALDAFDGCALKRTARNLVFGDGAANADLMVIGEAPGREEDASGVPFVGRSGQLLDRMLAAIGRDRTNSYITNIIFWRPPGNRTPTPHEAEVCRVFTERHIGLVAPKLILSLGGPASKALGGTSVSIMRLRGQLQQFSAPDGTTTPLLPTLHPAYLLRNPAQKRFAWRDLLAAKRLLDQKPPNESNP